MNVDQMKSASVVFWLFLICLAAALLPPALSALGGGEKDVIQVSGTVRLVGSSPMYEVVISGGNGHWYIARKEQSKLMDLQHRKVTVEGKETVEELTFANGLPAGTRRTLSKVKIIAIE